MCHYIPSTSHEDELDVVLLHIGSNDINNQRNNKINTEKLTEGIINIGSSCINLGVKEVTISSILPENNIALTHLIRQVNDILRKQCVLNVFRSISYDNISRIQLWKDGIHLDDLVTKIQAVNFVVLLNRFILSKSNKHSKPYTYKNLKGLYGNVHVLYLTISYPLK